MCQQDLPSQRRQEQIVESANRGVGAKSYRTRSSTTPIPSTLQDWTLYEAHVVRALVSNSNTISDEDDALSIAIADDISERDPELRHWYAPPKPSPLLVSCLPLMCLEKAQEPAKAVPFTGSLFDDIVRPASEDTGSNHSLIEEPDTPYQLTIAEEALRHVRQSSFTEEDTLLRENGLEWVRKQDFWILFGGHVTESGDMGSL